MSTSKSFVCPPFRTLENLQLDFSGKFVPSKASTEMVFRWIFLLYTSGGSLSVGVKTFWESFEENGINSVFCGKNFQLSAESFWI